MEKPIYGEEFSIGSGSRSATIEELIEFLQEKQEQGFTDISVDIEWGYYNSIEDIKIIAEKPYN